MSQLDSYIARFGPSAGPKLYHAIRSRSALVGANRRRRATIARLTGRPDPRTGSASSRESTGLLPFARADEAVA